MKIETSGKRVKFADRKSDARQKEDQTLKRKLTGALCAHHGLIVSKLKQKLIHHGKNKYVRHIIKISSTVSTVPIVRSTNLTGGSL
jgi:hypothetical protein